MDQPATKTRAEVGLSLLVVVAAWLGFAGPLGWNPGNLFLGDAGMLDVPRRLYAARELREGRWPWWTSDLACGFPLFAESQVALLYPPNWMLVIAPTGKTMDWLFAGHYLLAGLGTWGWLRARGIGPPGAAMGSVFLFTSPFAVRLCLSPSAWETLAWLPSVLWGMERVRSGASGVAYLVAAGQALMILAGFPQMAATSCAVAGLVWLGRLSSARGETTVREIGTLFLLPLALTAVQWGALAGFYAEANRADGLSWQDFQAHRLAWSELGTLGMPACEPQSAYRGFTDWSLLGHGLAWLWLVPALWGRRAVWRHGVGLVLVVGGVLLACWTPAQFLLWHVPIFNRFRWHNLYLAWSLVGGTLLVSAGFERTTAWFVQWQTERVRRASWLAWGLVLALAAIWVWRPLSQFASTTPFYQGANPQLVAAARDEAHFRLWPAADAHEEAAHRGRVDEEAMLASRALLPADYSLLDRVPNARLISERDTVSPGALAELWYDGNAYRAGLSRLWRLAAVTDVTALRPLSPEWLADLELRERDKVAWYRLRVPRPRAWLVHQAEIRLDPAERLARLASAEFDPARHAVVEVPVSLEPGPAFPAQVTCREIRPGALQLDVSAPAQGLLVIADRYTADTRAWLDGRPTQLLRTNHAFRGVVVPRGRHVVSMRYCPQGLGWGAACSVASGGFWLAGAWGAAGWPGRRRVRWVAAAVVVMAEIAIALWQAAGGCV